MTDRDRLTEIIEKSFVEQYEKRGLITVPHTADDLLANGVIVPPCKVGEVVDSFVYNITKNKDDLIKEICDLNNEKRKLERKIARLEKALKESNALT